KEEGMILESLREGRPGCPSDLQLDRLAAGEPASAAERHVAGCACCTDRLQQRRLGFAAFPDVDPARIGAAIGRRLAQEPPAGRLRRWWERVAIGLAVA